MKLTLERYCYSETETEGILWLNSNEYVFTLERPWRPPGPTPGGLSFESCVPDGSYDLIPHQRPSGDNVFALRNPDNGVFYTKERRPENAGRYLILIHAGNFVDDVVGCIAPGMSRTIYNNRRMVTNSREAMRRIMARKYTSIDIVPACGTED